MGVASSIYGILKVSYPNGQQPLIGRDISITLMAFFQTSFGFFGLVMYLHVIIQFLKGYSRMMASVSREKVLQRLEILGFYSWFIAPCVVIFSLLPLIGTAYPLHSTRLSMVSLIGNSISCFVYGLICCNCLSIFIKELDVYIHSVEVKKSEDFKVIVNRLKAAYIAVAG
jgi:hypothetical protein